MLGTMLNRSRDLVRQACTMIPAEKEEATKAIGRWMIAFTRCFKMQFQPDEWSLKDELGNIMKPEELSLLEKTQRRWVFAGGIDYS